MAWNLWSDTCFQIEGRMSGVSIYLESINVIVISFILFWIVYEGASTMFIS